MSSTVGELLTATLAELGVTQVFGIVGDALNPFTDAIRREPRIDWLGVRHEEGAALAAAGQAKVTGRLGVCAGTTGPGATHLLAGLYEASHDHAPVLAIFADPHNLGQFDADDSAARQKLILDDFARTTAQADAFQAGIPSSRVVRLPNASHMIFESNEADVLREINAFMAKLK